MSDELQLAIEWICDGCQRHWEKRVPAIDNITVYIACPHCDPQNLAAYGVTELCPVCHRGEHMVGCPRMLDAAP